MSRSIRSVEPSPTQGHRVTGSYYPFVGLYLGPLRLSACRLNYGQPGWRIFGWIIRAIWIPRLWGEWSFKLWRRRPGA